MELSYGMMIIISASVAYFPVAFTPIFPPFALFFFFPGAFLEGLGGFFGSFFCSGYPDSCVVRPP